MKSGPNYVVHIATADVLKLAEEDDATRRAVALYLAYKAKNGTPMQKKIAKKSRKDTLFSTDLFVSKINIERKMKKW